MSISNTFLVYMLAIMTKMYCTHFAQVKSPNLQRRWFGGKRYKSEVLHVAFDWKGVY